MPAIFEARDAQRVEEHASGLSQMKQLVLAVESRNISLLPKKQNQLVPSIVEWAKALIESGKPALNEEKWFLFLLQKQTSIESQERLWNIYRIYLDPFPNDRLVVRSVMGDACRLMSYSPAQVINNLFRYGAKAQQLIIGAYSGFRKFSTENWIGCLTKSQAAATDSTASSYKTAIAKMVESGAPPHHILKVIGLVPDTFMTDQLNAWCAQAGNILPIYLSDAVKGWKENQRQPIHPDDLFRFPMNAYTPSVVEAVGSYIFDYVNNYYEVDTILADWFAVLDPEVRIRYPAFLEWLVKELNEKNAEHYYLAWGTLSDAEWSAHPKLMDAITAWLSEETKPEYDRFRRAWMSDELPYEAISKLSTLPPGAKATLRTRLIQVPTFQANSQLTDALEAELFLICSAVSGVVDGRFDKTEEILVNCHDQGWLQPGFLQLFPFLPQSLRVKHDGIIHSVVDLAVAKNAYDEISTFLKKLPDEERKKWQLYLYKSGYKNSLKLHDYVSTPNSVFLHSEAGSGNSLDKYCTVIESDQSLVKYPEHREVLDLLTDLKAEVGNHQQRAVFAELLGEYLNDPSQSFVFLNGVARAKRTNGKSMLAVSLGLYGLGFRADLWISQAWQGFSENARAHLVDAMFSVLKYHAIRDWAYGDHSIKYSDVSSEMLAKWLNILHLYILVTKEFHPTKDECDMADKAYDPLLELLFKPVEQQIREIPNIQVWNKTTLLEYLSTDDNISTIETAWKSEPGESVLSKYRLVLPAAQRTLFTKLVNGLAKDPNKPPYYRRPGKEVLFGREYPFKPSAEWWRRYTSPFVETIQIKGKWYLLHSTHHPKTLFELGDHPATGSCYGTLSTKSTLTPGILGIVGNPQVSALVLRPILDETPTWLTTDTSSTPVLDEVALTYGGLNLGKPVAKIILTLGRFREQVVLADSEIFQESKTKLAKTTVEDWLTHYCRFLSELREIEVTPSSEVNNTEGLQVTVWGGIYQGMIDDYHVGILTPINQYFALKRIAFDPK